MKKTSDKPLKTMSAALQSMIADGRQKAAAFRFLQMDLGKLRTEQDFEEACAGLWSAQALLGPLDDGYRKTLADLQVTLDRTIKQRLLPGRDHDRNLDDLHAAIFEAFGCFKPHMPVEVWDKAEGILQEAFSKARLREGLRA